MKTSLHGPLPDHSNISSIAYRLWQEAGRPPGRYLDFWMQATELVNEIAKEPAPGPEPNPA